MINNRAAGGVKIFSRLFSIILLSFFVFSAIAVAQDKPQDRLAQGKEGKNKLRGGVATWLRAKNNMARLFDKIMISGEGDGKADKWYSPHLRDLGISGPNRQREAVNTRGQTAPEDFMWPYCNNFFDYLDFVANPIHVDDIDPKTGLIKAACQGPFCTWHGDGTEHRPFESCFSPKTTKYRQLKDRSNFKACCVREEEREWTSEKIAATHTEGDGWAGLFEYYFPVTAVGWENDRTTTMIVEKDRVKQCTDVTKPLMHSGQAASWVTEAIERGAKYAGEGSDSGGAGNGAGGAGNVRSQVQQDIGKLKPEDEELQMTDSLDNIGLTVRVNLATMDPEYRKQVARRFCMREEQFDKLMDPNFRPHPKYGDSGTGDPTQREGGPTLQDLVKLPIWSNYCKEGVELMLNSQNSSRIRNFDNTPSDFPKGMEAWKRDPRYCQKMNLENPSIQMTGFNTAIEGKGANSGWRPTEEEVGFTCRQQGKLNGGAVPVAIGRHAPVERRTVIGDQVYAMLHSARLAPGMHTGNKSFLKGYDDRPYTYSLPSIIRTFIGRQFRGGGTNEMDKQCPITGGELYTGENKGDKLYLSDVTHEAFTQDQVWEAGERAEPGINRYAQEWAKDPESGKEISKRGLDDKSQNYATSFRFFATCPANYVRWRPPKDDEDQHTLENLDNYCKEEYFGGIPNRLPGPGN